MPTNPVPANPSPGNLSWYQLPRGQVVITLGIVLMLIPVVWVIDLLITKLWVTISALVPAFLVVQHGLYIWLFKTRSDPCAETSPSNATSDNPPPTAQEGSGAQSSSPIASMASGPRPAVNRARARREAARQFSPASIALEYLTPTILVAIGGLVPGYLLAKQETTEQFFGPEVTSGIIFGALGGYVYVLMLLGERSFQRDITAGVAIWGAVQLFLGPVLGGAPRPFSALLAPWYGRRPRTAPLHHGTRGSLHDGRASSRCWSGGRSELVPRCTWSVLASACHRLACWLRAGDADHHDCQGSRLIASGGRWQRRATGRTTRGSRRRRGLLGERPE